MHRFTVSFRLSGRANKEGLFAITLFVSIPNGKSGYNEFNKFERPESKTWQTGFFIAKDDFDKGRVKSTAKGAGEINRALELIKAQATVAIDSALSKGLNSFEAVSKILNKDKATEDTNAFFEFAYSIIENAVQTKTNMPRVILGKRKTLEYLNEYANMKGIQVTFDCFDEDVLSGFVAFLLKEKRHSNATMITNFRYLKSFLNKALAMGKLKNVYFKAFKLGYKKDRNTIALSKEEMNAIENLVLTNKPLEIARDLFLFQALTGLRFIDLRSVKRENIKENDGRTILRITIKKTKKPLDFPLTSKAIDLLKKYDYSLPKTYDINERLKVIAKLAGFTENVRIDRLEGNELHEIILPKYELVSSHVARRTWATLQYKEGLQLDKIQRFLGHESVAQTQQYLRLDNSDYYNDIVKDVF